MGKVSVVLTAIEEEAELLPRTVNSVKSLTDEIVVINNGESKLVDETAKKLGAMVYPHKFVNYVEPVRNFGISKVTNEWILILDPDEEVTPGLVDRLKLVSTDNKADYVLIPRKNIIFGKWMKHSRWWPDYNVRFFKKGKVFFSEIIHSPPQTLGQGIDLPAEEKYAIVHNHYNSIEQFIERMNRYTSVQADNKAKDGYKFDWTDLFKKPFDELLSRYFAGRGYKDGFHGLVVASLQFISEFIVYLKLWQKEKFPESEVSLDEMEKEIRRENKDFYWWMIQTEIEKSTFPKSLLLKVYRKFFLK